MKQCTVCHKDRDEADFPPKSGRPGGRANYCRACDRGWERIRYAKNRDKHRARAKEKNKINGHLIQAKRDPFKRRASVAINNAVSQGRMIKPTACQGCGWTGRLHGHHEDYSKPFEVEWLCSICHGLRHRKEGP
jgi:hypothetical protein